MDECDIVVTNPPFSCYRPYVATLMEHKKKFIIWSNNNSITYKEIFPLLKNNEMWLGYTANKTLVFRIPDTYEKWDEKETQKMNDGNHYAKVPAISVFTNLDIEKRHEKLILWKNYTPEEYPTYDNYDAINVNKVAEIPCDYDGVIGVPITFLGQYNPKQFKIIGMAHGDAGVELGLKPYPRELKKLNKGMRDGDLYYMKDGMPILPYRRILVRRKRGV